DHGMIFYFFKTRIVRMWMKNTYLPLDMIFIRADGTIVSVAHSAVPESLVTVASEGVAVSALELSGGTAKRLGIKAGDLIRHKVFGNLD
ncbi:MAG: DUF192 domain-containing protein, partial [Sphingomonadales bacterium]